jgi:putative ATP-binding cassette transporter
MFFAIIGVQYLSVQNFVRMTEWEKALFDSLEARQLGAMGPLIFRFLIISLTTIGLVLVQGYMSGMLKMRWRSWLTADYMERWLQHDRYLDIERTGIIDNPDQRIAEDLDLFPNQMLEMVLSIISVVMGLVTFGGLLLAQSQPIAFSVAGYPIAIPGDLLIYAVLYAVVTSWLITFVGKPLVRWTIEQQHLAANFRFRLINIRRNAEQIAFARTIATEWRRLTNDFRKIFANYRGVTILQQSVGAVGGLIGSLRDILPIFLLMPKYLSGRMTLGTMMQNRGLFQQFNASLSYVVQAYTTIATLIAIVARIRHLDWAIASPTPSGITVVQDSPTGVSVRNLRLATPTGAPLVVIDDWQVEQGQRWSIRGPSGIGKSTLLRAVAGIWPYGEGEVSMPAAGRTMFVPQRSFLPIGTLKEALCFPAEPEAFDDTACRQVLAMFRLYTLSDVLDREAVWQDRLSPGEQQRLSFARIILQRPDTLFLDEATSALDPDNANHAYQALLAALPDLTLVSVVHDPHLDVYHNRRLDITNERVRIEELPDAIRTLPPIN